MLIAGLTGGIATGKSLISNYFKKQGAEIIDADQIAHDVVRSGRPAWQDIVDFFGDQYLLENGEINRQALGDAVFADHEKKARLNQIVHPHVFAEINRQIQTAAQAPNAGNAVTILDVPLLFESGMHQGFADIIVVHTDLPTQIKRLMVRDGIDETAALVRINAQIPVEEKKALATFLIDNNGSIDNTLQQADTVYRKLKAKAAA